MNLPKHAAGIRVSGMVVHARVAELLAVEQYEQRTPAWYEVRKGLMTASDAAGTASQFVDIMI